MTPPPTNPSLVLPAGSGSGNRVPVTVIVHLSGRWRGTTQQLTGDSLRVGTAMDAEIRVSPEPCVAPHHATVRATGSHGFEIVATADRPVWVNGEPVQSRRLTSGDILEIGRDGPLLRFRVYPPGTHPSKSVAEAFSDGAAGARLARRSPPARAVIGTAGALRELAVRSPLWFRLGTGLLLAALAASTVLLLVRDRRLEERLTRETARVEGLSELIDQASPRLTGEKLAGLRQELVDALERVEVLEERRDAPARVVAATAPAVALLQGSYGFDDPESGQQLRFLGLGATGKPLRDATGELIIGLGGDGPAVEVFFTGTAFLASSDGMLLTNRHLAVPWSYDAASKRAVSSGLEPRMRRLIAYLPGVANSFAVRVLRVSEAADLALLLAPQLAGRMRPLRLRGATPTAGEEVIVLGYPAGIEAILARADPGFLDGVMTAGELGFWQMAEQLAESGQIGPLASRGIVAQVSQAAVVYDAETTQGGSGGPVLGLDGTVIAITSAVVTDFGGSNLGVPAMHGSALLAEEAARRLLAAWPG